MAKIKKVLSIIIILALFTSGSLFTVQPVIAATNEVWVDNGWIGHISGDLVNGHTFGTDAFAKIQDGINAVASPGTVHVTAGSYLEKITLKNGVQVLGAGASVTTINAGGSGSVVTATSVGSATKLDGFTITNGNGGDYGGGMIAWNGCSAMVSNCTFSSNYGVFGGGIGDQGGHLTVTNCTFSGNSSYYGGGICVWNGSSSVVTNCVFSGNSAGYYGSGVFGNSASPVVTNCNFYNNSCSHGVFYNYNGANLTIANCIIWGSSPICGDVGYNLTYSDAAGGYAGTGNINADPLFVNAATGNYHLQATSPCIDSGNNSASSLPSTDFEGDPRIVDGNCDTMAVVDMGVDELEPNLIHVNFGTNYNYGVSGDSFTNTSVTGSKNWNSNINNPPDSTGQPVTSVNSTLTSTVTFDEMNPTPSNSQSPYLWQFGDIAENNGTKISINSTSATVSYQPGFDVSRSITPATLGSGGDQTLTVTVIPRVQFNELGVMVNAQEDNYVNPTITSPVNDPGANIWVSDDKHNLNMNINNPVIGQTYTETFTLHVILKNGITFFGYMPYVGINGNISGDSGIVSGSTLTKDIAGLGTWSWSATGSYVWNWYTSLNYGVNLQSYSFVITTTVTVNAPAKVEWNNYEFDVPINISQVTNFYGAQFDVLFDSTVLQYVSATWGQIGTTPLTGSGTTQSSPIIGGHRFLLSISNLQGGISGSGTIVTIRFRVIGSIGQSSPINLANGQLSDFNAQAIPAAWINASVLISVIPGDANGDGVMNVLDMTKTAREILLLDPLTPGADANLDGNVNVLDMTKIARIILGLDSQ